MNRKKLIKKLLIGVYTPLAPVFRVLGIDIKSRYELAYWKAAKAREGTLNNAHYEAIYTTDIGIPREFYAGKKLLDIGCGPRGSLEWADMAAERVGLDPLVDKYRALGIDQHKMRYVHAPSEAIPFPEAYFDIVTSINSLDHVDDLDKTIQEIIRVVRPGGYFLLVVEIHSKPTIAEPITLTWDVTQKFLPHMQVVEEAHYAQDPARPGAVGGIQTKIPFDHANPKQRDGSLYAKLVKG